VRAGRRTVIGTIQQDDETDHPLSSHRRRATDRYRRRVSHKIMSIISQLGFFLVGYVTSPATCGGAPAAI